MIIEPSMVAMHSPCLGQFRSEQFQHSFGSSLFPYTRTDHKRCTRMQRVKLNRQHATRCRTRENERAIYGAWRHWTQMKMNRVSVCLLLWHNNCIRRPRLECRETLATLCRCDRTMQGGLCLYDWRWWILENYIFRHFWKWRRPHTHTYTRSRRAHCEWPLSSVYTCLHR